MHGLDLRRYFTSYVLVTSLLALAGLTGCSSSGSVLTSLGDLNSRHSNSQWRQQTQRTIVSVPGSSPMTDTGTLQFYLDQRQNAKAIGLSQGDSYISETIIDSDCDAACLATIRNNILLVRARMAMLVEKKITFNQLRDTLATPQDEDHPLDPSQIADLNNQLIEAREDMLAMQQQVDNTYQQVLDAMNKNGVMIYRWHAQGTDGERLGLGELNLTNNGSSDAYGGFALVSGVRIASMVAGQDVVKAWCNVTLNPRFLSQVGITTYVMQAKHIAYITEYDLKRMTEHGLLMSFEQMRARPDYLKELDKANADYSLSAVNNLANMGLLGKAKHEAHPINWQQKDITASESTQDDWQTFFSVETNMGKLAQAISPQPVTCHDESDD